MKSTYWSKLVIRFVLILLAAVAPNAFPAAQAGLGTLHNFGLYLIIPAALLLVITWGWLRRGGFSAVADTARAGALAGAVATFALEAFRYSGFKLGFMPGNLPELMGVLLLDRFASGPSTASTLVGFAYHFWNGACFGIIFALGRFKLSAWWAIPYGILLGIGFLASPVVQSLGVGVFGVDFGWRFAATVLAAHLAFGIALAGLLNYYLASPAQPHCAPRVLSAREAL
jgi:hypothetical protein